MILDSISFNCHAVEEDFRAFVKVFLDELRARRFPAVDVWHSASVQNGSPTKLGATVEALPRSAGGAGKAPTYLEMTTGRGINLSAQFHPDQDGTAFCSLSVRMIVKRSNTDADLVGFQNSCLALCASLMERFHLHSADMKPEPGGLCLPFVPLVSGSSHIVITNAAEAVDLYEDPDAFWKANWRVVAETNGQRLLAREMDVAGGAELLKRILGPQWDMCRAAKAGQCDYDHFMVRPEEEPIFKAGKARLESVGYSEDERLLEYSCALDKGQHIQGWEIFALRSIIVDGKSTEGWPVKTVRIVFLEKWMAEQEKRPLLDIGCHVCHYQDDGEPREITE